MIQASLTEAERARVHFVPVRDYYDDQRWSAAVQKKVEQAAGVGAVITLVGYEKDASSYYLNHFPQWQMETVAMTSAIDATDIRRAYFESENMDVTLSVLAPSIPLPVRQYLRTWSLLPDYATLVEEHRFIAKYKTAWAKAPYAPMFVTVDAVVRCAGHVLLIQRGGQPGKGQWAVPGGFLEQQERLLQSAIRELAEETQLGVLASSLEGALVEVKVFDHPGRSQRGRTITHAHYFDLALDSLPVAEAADDAALLRWVPIADLAHMEADFYEDHFHILDQFLHLSSDD